jgi:hypothetical protein
MAKEYTLGELANIMGQADVLRLRITESKSQLGHKEHMISENEKAISNAESLKARNKEIAGEIEAGKKQIGEDETKLNELFKILKDNGVPVADRLKGTTIVNMG